MGEGHGERILGHSELQGKNWGAGHRDAQHKPLASPICLWVLTELGVRLTSCPLGPLPL